MTEGLLEYFRIMFPEFDAEQYPDLRVNLWGDTAEAQLDKTRWANFYQRGVALYIAHNLALEKWRADYKGKMAGSFGPKSSESISIDGASNSVNVNVTAYGGAGMYSMTPYGMQLWDLIQMVGIGVIQL